jgi:hypothetical protein
MVGDAFVERCVDRVRREVPDAVAVFFVGSQLRAEAGPFSDVDFDAVVADGPRDDGPAWYDQDSGRPLRISVWTRDADQWLGEQGNPQEWAFWLPCVEPLQLRWVADQSWRDRLDRTRIVHPAGPPELDHLVSDLGKLANAHRAGDELALRLAAHDVAMSAPSLLHPLNPGPPVTSRYAALRAALDAEVAPRGYRTDLLTCLGLAATPAPADVVAAASRLVAGLTDLLQSHVDTYADLLPADQIASLADGNLRRYVGYVIGD